MSARNQGNRPRADPRRAAFERLTGKPHPEVTFEDREWLRAYVETEGLSKDGMCYCYRPRAESTVQRPGSPFLGEAYYHCKMKKCGCTYFRWKNFERVMAIRQAAAV
jgi:hypothetical protein